MITSTLGDNRRKLSLCNSAETSNEFTLIDYKTDYVLLLSLFTSPVYYYDHEPNP